MLENARTQVNFGALGVAVVRLSSGVDACPATIRTRWITLAERNPQYCCTAKVSKTNPGPGFPNGELELFAPAQAPPVLAHGHASSITGDYKWCGMPSRRWSHINYSQ